MVQEEPAFAALLQGDAKGFELGLPLELVLDILGLLDVSTLVKCAAVCRTWLSLTRPRVFTHLVLTEARQTRLSGSFKDVLNHPLSTISSLVTSLTIMDPLDRTLSSDMLPLLNTLANVKELEVKTEGAFYNAEEFSMSIPTQPFRSVTSLKVSTDFPDFANLTTFICAFPLLESLYLDADWAGPAISPSTNRPPPSLRELRIKSLAEFIIPWFLSALPPIENLEVFVDHDVTLSNELLRALGPSLRRLELRFDEYFSGSDGSFDLSLNSRLESVQLKFYDQVVASCFPSFISREIRIRIASNHDLSLSIVDETMASLSFHEPEKPYSVPASGDTFMTLFPRCRAKSIACIVNME